MNNFHSTQHVSYWFFCMLFLSLIGLTAQAEENVPQQNSSISITQADWSGDQHQLTLAGTSDSNQNISLTNADSSVSLGQTTSSRSGAWTFMLRIDTNANVPCRVRATYSSNSAVRDVRNAPRNCNQGDGNPPPPPPPPPPPLGGDFTVLAANDLGMHCADLDYQIFSILPPFNVVHAQVIRKGTASTSPLLIDNTVVDVRYSASSSATDPAGANSINTTSQNSPGVYKANFWDISALNTTFGGTAYGPLYPSVLAVDATNACQTTFSCPSVLSLFEPIPQDTGLPVPDLNALFPLTGTPNLVVLQQSMPGVANVPQHFARYDANLPFFANLPFGSRIQNVKWFAADAIPILPVDDSGRSNAYPLMRVAAHSLQDATQLAFVDVVLPVASEADCQNCHVHVIDCADPGLPANIISDQCNGSAVSITPFTVMTLDDNPPGQTRVEQLLNTAKINILRLHDAKHGTQYKNWDTNGQLVNASCVATNPSDPNCLSNQTPVQCSRCHYSPALDLAQVGPANEPQQGNKGRQQTSHISMSRAMHAFHGAQPPFQGQTLFPAMPAPNNRTAQVTQSVLEATCYQCHPGKRTQCLRGAMASGGVVCQDCHGDMAQVGNDFTGNLPNSPFPAGADLSKRVPWATEPKCQSCHTGDAVSNMASTAGTIPADSNGIRLRVAYLQGDANATPIVAVNKRFAESESLYRLSKGHGGVMCEACHGSTHAIWPIQNAAANDNVAAQQLQGHSGTVIECTTCHAADSLGITLGGPHGMHPVGDSNWNRNHSNFAENNSNSCRTCHGPNGEGTVLSRMAVTRTLRCNEASGCSNGQITLNKGTQVGCATCHGNQL